MSSMKTIAEFELIYLADYPGTIHNNQVRSKMQHFKELEAFLECSEKLLCDSAYGVSENFIPVCEKGTGANADHVPSNAFFAEARDISN